MSQMNENVETYSGTWWGLTLTEGTNSKKKRYKGVLYRYPNGRLELKIDFIDCVTNVPLQDFDIVWGNCDGRKFTLFNVRNNGYEYVKRMLTLLYDVEYALRNAHISSIDTKLRYNSCIVTYKYLRQWITKPKITHESDNDTCSISIDTTPMDTIVESEIENDISVGLYGEVCITHIIDSAVQADSVIHAENSTLLQITSGKRLSVCSFTNLINEFSIFLSIICMCRQQHPTAIQFQNRDANECADLWFERKELLQPTLYGFLIDSTTFRQKGESILKAWHSDFARLYPIADYMIRSSCYDNVFNITKFTLVAHALDGYFKRFVNKKDKSQGKNHQKYKDEVIALLDLFKDIDVIKDDKEFIDTKALADSRNAYSHLIPEEEQTKVVTDAKQLFQLTQKCKMLLYCCILKYMGLSMDDINECCNISDIKTMTKEKMPKHVNVWEPTVAANHKLAVL